MIVVRIEKWPEGDATRAFEIGRLEIANDHTSGTELTGHYDWNIHHARAPLGQQRLPWRAGSLTNFPRRRLTVWDLLCRVLREAVGERNLPTDKRHQ